jgi:hypothetical protein
MDKALLSVGPVFGRIFPSVPLFVPLLWMGGSPLIIQSKPLFCGIALLSMDILKDSFYKRHA